MTNQTIFIARLFEFTIMLNITHIACLQFWYDIWISKRPTPFLDSLFVVSLKLHFWLALSYDNWIILFPPLNLFLCPDFIYPIRVFEIGTTLQGLWNWYRPCLLSGKFKDFYPFLQDYLQELWTIQTLFLYLRRY